MVHGVFCNRNGFFTKLITNQATKKAKQNQIACYYVYNADTDKSKWLTYDINLDSWTKEYLGDDPKNTALMKDTPLASKNKFWIYVCRPST
jgi:hypothetical protein